MLKSGEILTQKFVVNKLFEHSQKISHRNKELSKSFIDYEKNEWIHFEVSASKKLNLFYHPLPFKVVSGQSIIANISGVLYENSSKQYKYYDFNKVYTINNIPIPYCIEKDKQLQEMLIGKKYQVIDNDFLAYEPDMIFDYIIMNPPFSNGEKHFLKAWGIARNTEIVCLLNAENINNPYSESRKLIIKDVYFKYVGSGQGQPEGGLYFTGQYSTNALPVTLTNTVPALSQQPWLEGITMSGSNATRN
jgi:hypothetical protein